MAFPRINKWDSAKTKLRKLRRRIKFQGREGSRYGSIGGPLPFTDTLRYFDLLNTAQPPEVFYPITSPDWQTIFDQTFADGLTWSEHTYALQWWNSRASAHPGFNKNADFPRESLIEKLKRKHLSG